MPGSKSNYLENALLNGVLGGPQFTLPPNVFVALSTAAYIESATGTLMNEISAGGYARVALTNDATSWPTATTGTKTNALAITFPTASADWGIVRSFYICDAASGGNTLYGGDLLTVRDVRTGDTATFAANAITISED